MDLPRLRDFLRPCILALKDAGTHEVLPSMCRELGLPAPESNGSKRERMAAAFDALPDADLPSVAQQYLRLHSPHPSVRNEIQDLLWADHAAPVIPKRFRRELARALERLELYLDRRRFDLLLDGLWLLDDDPCGFFSGVDQSLRAEIDRHVHQNPEDWSVEELFDRLGALNASDRRFALFVEGLASAEVRPDEGAQRRFVQAVNESLQPCGVELREIDSKDGYPVFVLVSTRMATGRPKNLIFASSIKPDIRIRDAVNNDTEIATNADKVLVYDRPIPTDGLRWSDLQHWWSETQEIANCDEAKKSLYRRLREALPRSSPPQMLLFDAFYGRFGSAVPGLPALLPEVWLHWDPKTVAERGADALLRFRMDFLMLLPGGVRIVLEVDGKHHYAFGDGAADVARYAKMAAADRELKLAGYEVFRFGAHELRGDAGRAVVAEFFDGLFRRYRIVVGTGR